MKIEEIDTKKIDQETNVVIKQAEAIQVSNNEQYIFASEFLKNIVKLRKEVVSTFAEPKQKAHEAHKAITAAEKKHKQPLDSAERIIKGAITSYVMAEQKKKRLEAEAIAKKLKEEEEEKRLAEAEKAEAEGQTEQAEEIISKPVETPYVQPVVAVEKQEGISFSENWNFDIVDASLIPREFLLVDEKKIRQLVKCLKGETKIPGVQVKCEKIARVR